jgi:hypothetical protein
MNRHPRNESLLKQLAEHNPFRDTAERVFGIGVDFDREMEAIGQDRRLSQEGKKERAREHARKALGSLLDLQKSVDSYHQESERLRSSMKTPTYDKSDNYAAGLRRELRDRAVAMSFGQKSALMSGATRDPSFIDAVTEQPGWVSGFNLHNPNEAELFETAKQSRLADLNGDLMAALEARASVEAEIAMVIDIVRNDLESDATDLASRAA